MECNRHVSRAHLFALNRSKIPLLIMSGGKGSICLRRLALLTRFAELVPEAVFARSASLLTRLYLSTLFVSTKVIVKMNSWINLKL